MATLMDIRKVLQGYFSTHNAVRDDLGIIEDYMAQSAEERKRNRAFFEKWFVHHTQMIGEHNAAEDGYYFPEANEHLKDNGDFVRYMQGQSDQVVNRGKEVEQLFLDKTSDDKLLKSLQKYVAAAKKRMDDEQTIYVSMVMQNHTVESYKKLEVGYARSLSLRRLSTLLAWQFVKLTPEERKIADRFFPLPVSLLLTYFWIPTYLRRYPVPSWRRPRERV